MPPCPRNEIIDPDEVGIYHCVSRCVRRAFLCGLDALSGQCFDHRTDWIEQDTARLAAQFAIDVLDFCVMSNHIHHVLRNRPDIAEQWSDEEVVRRWWRICPERKEQDGSPSDMTEAELRMRLSDKDLVQEFRRRLSDISWFMKILKEPVAKRANREDSVTGHFWAGRFRSIRLLDSAAVLACSIYVDLNAIRAGQAETPEGSRYTSAWHRIQALLQENGTPGRMTMRMGNPTHLRAPPGRWIQAGSGWHPPTTAAGRLPSVPMRGWLRFRKKASGTIKPVRAAERATRDSCR